MPGGKTSVGVPDYKCGKWLSLPLPATSVPWPYDAGGSKHKQQLLSRGVAKSVQRALRQSPWRWPRRPVYFIADPHADTDAFSASLLSTGGVRRTGKAAEDFKLTAAGRRATFVIGGDCLDKGPSNLRLLRTVGLLRDRGARLKLLAGNHDIRLWLGMRAFSLPRDPRTEHFFVRMGPKVIPLLGEIRDHYFEGSPPGVRVPGEKACRRALYPSRHWFDEFPRVAGWLMPEAAVQRELLRMRHKVDVFESACREAGMTLRDVYATAQKCCELFLEPGGEFAWFFRDMQLAYRAGSFLFIHAGLDDRVATMIGEHGVGHLNRLYRPVRVLLRPAGEHDADEVPSGRHAVEPARGRGGTPARSACGRSRTSQPHRRPTHHAAKRYDPHRE